MSNHKCKEHIERGRSDIIINQSINLSNQVNDLEIKMVCKIRKLTLYNMY